MRTCDLRRRQGDMPQRSWRRRGFLWSRRWLWFVALAAFLQGALGNCTTADLPGFASSEPELGMLPASVPQGYLVKYICLSGFVRIPGKRSTTICLNNTWSPIEEPCSGNCSTARLPGFAYSDPKLVLLPASVPDGFLVTYYCKLGFVRIPGKKSTTLCHNNTWSPMEETCSVARCNNPVVKHGTILSGFKWSYEHGDNVTFECKIGYFMVGSYLIQCQNQIWYPAVPSCKKMAVCEEPIVEHGIKLSGFKLSYRDGDNVTFECKIGYFMIGSYFIQCENHTWYPAVPSCKKIDQNLCGAPILPNGMVMPLKLQYRIGSIIAVHCKPNYSFPDETIEMSLTCEGRNIWEPAVQPCFIRTSRDTSEFSIHNGKIVSGKKKFYEPGDKITVQCHPGFALNGPPEIRYVGGGKWLPVHPRCYLNAFFTLLITVIVFIALLLILEMIYNKWKSED